MDGALWMHSRSVYVFRPEPWSRPVGGASGLFCVPTGGWGRSAQVKVPEKYKFICDCAEVHPDDEEDYFAADYKPTITLAAVQ